MTATPALGITMMAENVLAKEIIFNEAVLKIETLTVAVAVAIQNSPPGGTPADGTTYIVGTSGSGLWAGHSKEIAFWYNGWQFITPTNRMRMYVSGAGAQYRYVSGTWTAEAAGTPTELADLSDVALGTPANGHVLTFNSGTGKWVALAAPSSVNDLNDLDDVTLTSPSAGQVLQWNGTQWVNYTPPAPGANELVDLDDVDVTGKSDGDILQWNQTAGKYVHVDPASVLVVTELGQLPDVDLTGLSVGDALVWNGATWGPSADLIEFKFENMTDGPGTMMGAANKFLVVDDLELSITYKSVAEVLAEGLDVRLQDLQDVPASIGTAGQVLVVNSGATGFVYATPSSGLTVQSGTDTPLTTAAKKLRFVGATLTEPVTDEITVTIDDPGQTLEFQDDGTPITDPIDAINFTGVGVTVSEDAGVLTVDITGASTLASLTDVEVITPLDGDILYWDASTSQWEHKPIATLVAEVDGVAIPNTYEYGPCAPPVGSMFPDRYQATGVNIQAVDSRGLVVIPSTFGSGPYHMAISRTVTNNVAPWTVTCRVCPNGFETDEHIAGIMIQRATNGSMVFVGVGNDQYDSLPHRLVFGHADGATHTETLVFNKKVKMNWLRLDFDGNTIFARCSNDGILWSTIGSLDAATVLGGVPTKVGLFQRFNATPSGGTGALYTYYDDPDFPATARTTMGFLLATVASLGDVDVLTTPPADGDVLAWNETEGKWLPVPMSGGGGGVTTLAALTDVDLTGLATGDLLKWNGTDWVPYKELHEVGVSIIAKPTSSEKLLRYRFASAASWPTNLSGSQFDAGIAATGSTTFTLKKNGTSIGTVVFSAAGTAGTATVTATTWAAGDVLLIEAPATVDATLAEISFTIKGTRA